MHEAAALSTRLSHHARLRCIMQMTVAYTRPLHHVRGRWVMRDAAGSCAMPPNHAPGRSIMCDAIYNCAGDCIVLQGKSHLCIPFLGIVRLLSPNFHIHVSVSNFLYSQDLATSFPAAE
jgi:hypothetical protein